MAFWNRRKKEELRTISFQDLWGAGLPTPTAEQMNTALTLAPVFAAVNLIAGQVATYPLQAYRKEGDTKKKIDPPPLVKSPTLFGTTVDWIHRCVVSLALKGNAYGLITDYDDRDFPSRIEWLDPTTVTIDNDLDVRRPVWRWHGDIIPFGELVHIPNFSLPGHVLGLSPIKAFATTTETGILAQVYGRDWFKNGAHPSGMVTSDLPVDESQAKRIKQRFKQAARERDVVVAGAGQKFEAVSANPEDAAYVATLRLTATEIANIYGLPPEMIGGTIEGRTVNYQNTEQRGLDVITYALRPYMVRIEKALFDLLPRPQFVKFNIDAYNRADLKTRYEAYAIGLGGSNNDPFLQVDEVREHEDLPPMPKPQVVKPVVPPPQMALPGMDQPKPGNGNGQSQNQPQNQEN